MGDARRYRLDDLRRYAAALAAGLGVAPRRASALASHLLWFDAVSAFDFGIATLPGLLDRIESGDVDPTAEGRVRSERAATSVTLLGAVLSRDVAERHVGAPRELSARRRILAHDRTRRALVGR